MCRDLVSIIVPVYKAENFLKECLDSILRQTHPFWECILVDDGSPDSSGLICDEYVRKDNRFKVIHKINGGVSSARRDGVNSSKGEWITFVDSDDIISDTALERLMNPLLLCSDIDIVIGAWVRQISTNRRPIPLRVNGVISNTKLMEALLTNRCYFGPVGRIFRRSLFNENTLLVPPSIINNEDLVMNLRLANNARMVACCPHDYVYVYRCNIDSASHRVANNDWSSLFECIRFCLGSNCSEAFIEYLLDTAIKYGLTYNFIKNWDAKLCKKELPSYLKMKLHGGLLKDNKIAVLGYNIHNKLIKLSKLPAFLYYKTVIRY